MEQKFRDKIEMVSQAELKGYFANGELPTGEHFAALIDSMVPLESFQEWTSQGCLELGGKQSKWRIGVDAEGGLHIERFADEDEENLPTPKVVLPGWVGMEGRFGTHAGDRDAKLKVPELKSDKMRSVAADGSWKDVLEAPPRSCAFELVAQVSDIVPAPRVTFFRPLARVLGLVRPRDAITHAIISSNSAGTRPTISQSGAQDYVGSRKSMWRWLAASVAYLLIILLPVLGVPLTDAKRADGKSTEAVVLLVDGTVAKAHAFYLEGMKGIRNFTNSPQEEGQTSQEEVQSPQEEAQPQKKKGQPPQEEIQLMSYFYYLVFALPLIFTVLRAVVAFRLAPRTIRLRWKKTGGSTWKGTAKYRLEMRNGHSNGAGTINYYVIWLWG